MILRDVQKAVAAKGKNRADQSIKILYFLHVLIYLLVYCCILGNIRAKWPSVCRRGMDSVERVVELFTGYKGPRSCVEVRTKAINKVKCSNGT